MKQRALTVIAQIKRDQVDSLRGLLNQIGDDISGNPHIRFQEIPTIHFARWVIIPEDAEKGYAPHLAMEANYDGDLDDLLDAFMQNAANGFDQIYGKCEGYPSAGTANREQFKKYFRQRMIPYNAFYMAYSGRSVREIQNNTLLRQSIEGFLDEQGDSGALKGLSAADVRRRIQDFLRSSQIPGVATNPLNISFAMRTVWLIVALVVALLLLLPFPVFFLPLPLVVRVLLFLTPLLLVGLFLLVLRMKEKKDAQIPVNFVHVDDAIFSRENYKVQNQLTHLVEIKEGAFRLYTLKSVLWVINLAARLFWYKGSLGGIPTIHFARWVMIDNSRRLLFFSNFDGSWENYLGDFIDKAAVGLTAVWSNTKGFPKTEFLLFKGARDEERFKEWARAQQVPTQVWYSAHPNETVRNILDNVTLRNQVEPTLNATQTESWLRLL
ncbi:MAG TPA: hypothetical protein VKA60_09320 [Blastocatellia bacterium]|nr:hypothetical protein [Blastocatellia bacterium]